MTAAASPGVLRPWLLAFRPPTLTAAAVPVLTATCLLRALGVAPSLGIAACALAAALCIQIGTNLFNDALDFGKGADTAERLGPPRAAQSGWISPRALLRAAWTAFAMAAALCLPLVARGGWPIAALGAVSLALGYAYTGGPFPIAYLGLGELFVVAFFGVAAVAGTAYVQAHAVGWEFWLAGVQVGSLAAVMIAVNNFRDSGTDARCGKRTLAVRLGPRFSRLEIALLALLPYGLGIAWIGAGLGAAWLLPLASLPLAVRVVVDVWRTPPGRAYNEVLKRSAALHLAFGLLLSGGFAIA